CFDALSLQYLAGIEEGCEILRLSVIAQHVVVDDGVAGAVLLVREHYRREDAGSIFRLGEGFNRLHLGKGLKTVFGDESPVMFLVFVEVGVAVPHRPVVRVSGLIGVAYVFIIRARRAWPIRYFGLQPRSR